MGGGSWFLGVLYLDTPPFSRSQSLHSFLIPSRRFSASYFALRAVMAARMIQNVSVSMLALQTTVIYVPLGLAAWMNTKITVNEEEP